MTEVNEIEATIRANSLRLIDLSIKESTTSDEEAELQELMMHNVLLEAQLFTLTTQEIL